MAMGTNLLYKNNDRDNPQYITLDEVKNAFMTREIIVYNITNGDVFKVTGISANGDIYIADSGTQLRIATHKES